MAQHNVLHGIIRISLLVGLFAYSTSAQEAKSQANTVSTGADTVTSQSTAALPTDLQGGKMFLVKLQDGGELLGKLTAETTDEITLMTSFGEVRIARSKIKELIPLVAEDIRKGEYWYPDPNQTRSFVFPTASTLPQGKGFYENYYLLFNSIHLGITDNAMASFGLVLLPEAVVFTFGPKVRVYQHPSKTVEMAIGAHFFGAMWEDDESAALIPYGVLSLGRPNKGRFNIGVGKVFVEEEEQSFLNLSGDVRVSRRVKLMGEMFFFPAQDQWDESDTFIIYGLRFFGEKLAFDMGFWNMPGEEGSESLTVFGTPLVNFVFRF